MSNALRYALSFGVPLLVSAAATPFAGHLARRLGILDHPEQMKFHHRSTPYLGGVAVAAGLAGVGLATAGASGQMTAIVLGGVAVCGLGLVDDWRTVGPIVKLAVEVGAALALWFSGVGAGLFGNQVLDAALTVVWVVAITNAINLIDNMDGLAPGVSAICALGFFALAASRGDSLVAALALGTSGAALGFLWHNFPPAKIFLGDAGSLLLGFLLAALGLKLDLVGQPGFVRSAIPVLILAVPIFDMALVVTARLRDGRPVYVGGTDHSSHRLIGRGMSPRGVALVAYAVQALCVAIALVVHASRWGVVVATSLALGVVALIALGLLLRTAPLPAVTAGGQRTEPPSR